MNMVVMVAVSSCCGCRLCQRVVAIVVQLSCLASCPIACHRCVGWRRLTIQKWSAVDLFCKIILANFRDPLRQNGKTFWTSEPSKGGAEPVDFLTFWLGNVLRAYNGVHLIFGSSSTSKSAPNWVCFAHFDLEMCFAPHRGVTFSTWQTSKSASTMSPVFYAFWLGNVLRATTACTFSTSQLPKVVRDWRVFFTFWLRNVLRATTACTFSSFSSLIWPDGSAPAALASLLFDPPEPQIIGKTQWIATFLPFRAPASSFFWLFLFSDLLSSSLLFSDSSHLCFSICPYCRKFDF